MRLLIINPNTNAGTTAMMADIARETLAESLRAGEAVPPVELDSLTVRRGVPLITHPQALAEAGQSVVDTLSTVNTDIYRGIIIAAFGDPGLSRARELTSIPVTGIAEAAMLHAPGKFAVVTTTPDLAESITDAAHRYGHAGRFVGVELTPGDPASLMARPEALLEAMLSACRRVIHSARPDSIVIGGGPLATVARELRPLLEVPVIEPIPAAVRLALRRATQRRI